MNVVQLTAMWTHGHDVELEHPGRFTSVQRRGNYVRLIGKNATRTWVHFAVPTPVIADGTRARADAVLLRFRTTPTDAAVTAVHVYDGERRIATHNNRNDRPAVWQMIRYDIPKNPSVRWGIGISVQLSFSVDPAGKPPFRIDIAAAGCDFRV